MKYPIMWGFRKILMTILDIGQCVDENIS